MSTGFFKVPKAKNEIVKSYRPGSPERKEVIETYQKMISSVTKVPMYINGKDVKSKSKKNISKTVWKFRWQRWKVFKIEHSEYRLWSRETCFKNREPKICFW